MPTCTPCPLRNLWLEATCLRRSPAWIHERGTSNLQLRDVQKSMSAALMVSSNGLSQHVLNPPHQALPRSGRIPSKRIPVVTFSICKEPTCHSSDVHLLVKRSVCDLKRGHATAISYAWGASSCQQRCLGHCCDGSPVSMKLGEDCDVPDLAKTLSRLSTKPSMGQYWIDQLCVDKRNTDDGLDKTLASIPDISRKLDVIALFADGICQCWTAWDDPTTRSFNKTTKRFEHYSLCPGNSAFGHWFDRVWTRQEFQYARNIGVEWTSQPRSCDIKVYHRNLSETLETDSLVYARTHPEQMLFKNFSRYTDCVRKALGALPMWLGISGKSYVGKLFLVKFLNGQSLSRGHLQIYAGEHPMEQHTHLLSELSSAPRRATQPHDIVLAIWPDLSGYCIPIHFKSMTPMELLSDALQQMIDLQSQPEPANYPCVALPAGLFGQQVGTAL